MQGNEGYWARLNCATKMNGHQMFLGVEIEARKNAEVEIATVEGALTDKLRSRRSHAAEWAVYLCQKKDAHDPGQLP